MNNMTKKIIDLLAPNNTVIQENLKTILDKEYKYAEFLCAIEDSVIEEFLRNETPNRSKLRGI